MNDNNDKRLRSVLREWVVDTPLPPRFQEQVWKRIARTEALPALGLWNGVSRWLDAVLPRPKVAFAYIAALMILGVAAGAITAQVKSSHLNAALGERYVQSIDPYRAEVPHQ